MRRRFKILFISGLALLSLILVALMILVGTQAGRVWVAQIGLYMAADRFDGKLQWQGIQSPQINHWQLDSLKITGAGTAQIEASGIDVRWQALKLFSGHIILDALRLKMLTVGTVPERSGRATDAGAATSKMGIPVIIHSLAIDDLELPLTEDAVARRLRVSGNLDVNHSDAFVTAELQISPVNGDAFRLKLSASTGRDGTGRFTGTYSETPQGPVSLLLELPQNEPFESAFTAGLDHPPEGNRLLLRELTFNLWQHDFAIKGDLQQDGTALVTKALHIDVDGNEQLLKGRVTKEDLELQLDLDSMPLDIASSWIGAALDGSVGGHFDIHGNFTDPAASGELKIHTRYRGQPLTMEVRGTASRDRLHIDRSVITTRDDVLVTAEGTVDIGNRTLDLDAVIDDTNLERLSSLGVSVPATIKGVVNAHSTIQGPWDRPELKLLGGFKGFYKDDVPVVLNISAGTVVPPVKGARESRPRYELAIQHMDLQIREHKLAGQGNIMLSLHPLLLVIQDASVDVAGTSHPLSGQIEGDHLALDLTLEGFPLDILAPLLATPVSGAVSGKVFLGGTFSDPLLRGRLDSDLTWQRLHIHLNSELDATRERLEIKQADMSSAAGTFSGTGVVDFYGAETHLQINAREVEPSLLQRLKLWIPPSLNGRMQADLAITGRMNQPVIEGMVQFTGSYQETPVSISIAGAGNQDRFSITDMELNAGENGRLILRGGYDDKSGADFNLDADRLPVQLLRWHDWELPPGSIDASVTVKGTPQQLQASGNISYRQSQQGEAMAAVLSAMDAQVTLDPDHFDVLMSLAGENARSGNIRISFPWRRYLDRPETQTLAQLPLAGTIHAEAYLQELCALLVDTDMHDCRGGIKAELTLSNTLDAPRFDGMIVLEDGSYENLVSGTSLHDIHMDVRARGNRLELVKGTAADGDKGKLALEGGAHWQDSIDDLDVNLLLRVTDAHLLHRYDMDGIANGTLTLTGGLKEMFLSGGLQIRPFTLALEALLQEDIPTLKISNEDTLTHREQASRQKWQWLPSVNLNVELSADQQAFLRGQGLEAELKGKMLIQGTYPDTVYRGNFKTVRGNVHILGKKFALTEGEVRLENEVFSLLIPATYKGKDIEVKAVLSGTADELHLALSSSPVYPEDEIVSRLLFNKSSENISPLQAIRLANAISILKFGGKPLFDPLGKIQKTLTVDSLNMEDAENGNGVMLGVGKYINEKVYVEVETGTGAGEPWQGNIQIELLPNLSLENTINGETGFGNIELQWKKDY